MKQQIQTAAKLYNIRDTMKRLFADDFQVKIRPYRDMLLAIMKENAIEVLPALTKALEMEIIQDNEMAQALFVASAVEMIEPSK